MKVEKTNVYLDPRILKATRDCAETYGTMRNVIESALHHFLTLQVGEQSDAVRRSVEFRTSKAKTLPVEPLGSASLCV